MKRKVKTYAELDAQIQADKERFRKMFPDLVISEEEEAYRRQFGESEHSSVYPLITTEVPSCSSVRPDGKKSALPSITAIDYSKERERIGHADYLMTIQEAGWFYGYEYSSMRIYIHKGLINTIGESYHGKRISHSEMKQFISNRSPSGRRPYGRNAESLRSTIGKRKSRA